MWFVCDEEGCVHTEYDFNFFLAYFVHTALHTRVPVHS